MYPNFLLLISDRCMEYQHYSDHHWDKTQSQLFQALYEWLLYAIYCSRSHIKVRSLGEGIRQWCCSRKGLQPPLHQMRAEQDKQAEHKTVLNSKSLWGGDKAAYIKQAAKQWCQPSFRIAFPCFFNLFFIKSTLYYSTINTADSALYAEWSIYQLSQSHERAKGIWAS